jgi:hypothetical protein
MKVALRVVGAILLLMGTTWFLQGINVLPGSFMSGQPRWAVNGAIADAVGVALVIVAGRIGPRQKGPSAGRS